MSRRRPTPFDLVFEQSAQEVFPKIRLALDQAGYDPRDRDAFLMLREVVTFLRELRPDEGLGEGIDQLAALVHHAYLFWDAGGLTLQVPPGRLIEVLGAGPVSNEDPIETAHYVQLPERRIWAQVIPGQPHEPLDGCFLSGLTEPGILRVLGVFGIHPERLGFSVVEVVGKRPRALARPDGSVLFAPVLPGGAAAGLFSVTGGEELLELGWRLHELGAGSWEPEAGSRERGAARSEPLAPSS